MDRIGLVPLNISFFGLGSVEFEQCVEQDVRAVGDVFGVGEFAGGVADAAYARDEDHADWTKAGHVLSIVAGARWHSFGCKTEITSGLRN